MHLTGKLVILVAQLVAIRVICSVLVWAQPKPQRGHQVRKQFTVFFSPLKLLLSPSLTVGCGQQQSRGPSSLFVLMLDPPPSASPGFSHSAKDDEHSLEPRKIRTPYQTAFTTSDPQQAVDPIFPLFPCPSSCSTSQGKPEWDECCVHKKCDRCNKKLKCLYRITWSFLDQNAVSNTVKQASDQRVPPAG